MKEEYDFSKGKRGAVDPIPEGKARVTLILDKEVIEWFRARVCDGGNYSDHINSALRMYAKGNTGTLIMVNKKDGNITFI